jgi:hypothetical protein
MEEAANDLGIRLPSLTERLHVMDTGLDSLSIAILFATLDQELGVDPFGAGGQEPPLTMGDLFSAYERALTVR